MKVYSPIVCPHWVHRADPTSEAPYPNWSPCSADKAEACDQPNRALCRCIWKGHAGQNHDHEQKKGIKP